MAIHTSQELDKISAALVALQAGGLVVKEAHENKQVKSRYAAFEDIQTTIRPLLKAHGLAYLQSIGKLEMIGQDSAQWVTTRIIHESGQFMEGSGAVLVPFISLRSEGGGRLNIAWASGSAISYAKRYSLCAMLGILTGDDDDAEKATMQTSAEVKAPSGDKMDVDLGLRGEIAEYTGGRWKEAAGPDNRLLGQYSHDELRNLVVSLIKEETELPAVMAILADSIQVRLRSIREQLVPALEARGWDDWPDPNDWNTAQWHKASVCLKQQPQPKP